MLPDCALWSDVPEDMELERKSFNLCRQILSRKGFDSSAGGFPLYDEVPTRAFGG